MFTNIYNASMKLLSDNISDGKVSSQVSSVNKYHSLFMLTYITYIGTVSFNWALK